MAPAKRKGNAAEEAATRQPQKRLRVGENRKNDQKKQKTEPSDGKRKSSSNESPRASELTILRDDEASFPRGGASVLTPLERKQIHVQAAEDVLFEQKSPKRFADNSRDDGEDDEEEDVRTTEADGKAAGVMKRRKRKTKGKKDPGQGISEPQGVRIEGLSFKVWFYPIFYRSGKLTATAYCAWVYNFGSSLQYQCSRYRSLSPQ